MSTPCVPSSTTTRQTTTPRRSTMPCSPAPTVCSPTTTRSVWRWRRSWHTNILNVASTTAVCSPPSRPSPWHASSKQQTRKRPFSTPRPCVRARSDWLTRRCARSTAASTCCADRFTPPTHGAHGATSSTCTRRRATCCSTTIVTRRWQPCMTPSARRLRP